MNLFPKLYEVEPNKQVTPPKKIQLFKINESDVVKSQHFMVLHNIMHFSQQGIVPEEQSYT